jgi:hypothetical protein
MSKNYEKYKNTYGYSDLLKTHALCDEGIWEIYGEDPNCDLGGHHHEPYLGTAKGKLEDVIQYAVDLPSFWQWGGGGRIKKKSDEKIVDVTKLMRNKKRIDELKKMRDDLNKKIEELEN